jgi:hypothetical protein
MSKKLLEESTIRSFMKLANLQPLTAKFLKESEEEKDEKHEEEDEEEDVVKEAGETRAVTMPKEREPEKDRLTEEELEEGEDLEEGKESEGRPSTPRPKVKGVAKPGKMDAAKNARKDDKMHALKAGTHHSDRDDTIDTKHHSVKRTKNNSNFEVVAESLEEMEEMEEQETPPPEAGADAGEEAADGMGSAGESGDHKEKMKTLIKDMLTKLSEMGSEYGMSMEVSDESGGPEQEAPETGDAEQAPPADDQEAVMQEMIEKLTNRVAARLVKESKKKR